MASFSLLQVFKTLSGGYVLGTWIQDCVGTTLEEAHLRAQMTEAANGYRIQVAVVDRVTWGGVGNSGPQERAYPRPVPTEFIKQVAHHHPHMRFAYSRSGDVIGQHRADSPAGEGWCPILAKTVHGTWAPIHPLPLVNGEPLVAPADWIPA